MRHQSMLQRLGFQQCSYRQRARMTGFIAAALGVLFCAPGPLLAAERPATLPAPAAADIARWVQELDADAYSVREAATNKLVAAGPAVVELLTPAMLSDSPEVNGRASLILEEISLHGDEATLDLISAALERLGSKRPALTKLTAEIRTQQAKFRHTRAIAKVRSLGGGLTGSWNGGADDLATVAMAVDEDEFALAPIAVAEVAPLEEPIEGLPVKEPEALPPPRGILGLLGRMLAPVEPVPPPPVDLIPAAAPPEFVPVAPAVDEDAAPAADAPAAEVPAPDVLPLPGFDVELPAALPAPVLDEGAVAEEAVLADVMIGPAVMGIDFAEAAAEAYAELTLDKQFRGSDADLAVLKDIPEIYSLSISDAKLTDRALEDIAALPRLTTFNVRTTPFSSAALRKLRQQRPELSIICRSSGMLGINAGLEGPCVITSVFYKSGAYDAGLRDGDEIIEVDGEKIRDFSDLTIAVYSHQPGDRLPLKYRRGGEEKSTEVKLKTRSE